MSDRHFDSESAYPRLRPLGESAWLVQFGETIDASTHARVMGFMQALAAAALPQLVECVAAYASVAVFFDDAAPHDAAASAAAELLALARQAEALAQPGRRWQLPLCVDAELAPDLAELAAARHLSVEQVVALLTSTPFRVYMLGFQPGFPYMGGLPDALSLPRRSTPRTDVPARSVAVAGGMCAVYPWRSPGGWHLVGRTPVRLFDVDAADPAWLHAGDEVRWQLVDRARFDALEAQAEAGRLRRADWLQQPPGSS